MRACWAVQDRAGCVVGPRVGTVWVPISITNRDVDAPEEDGAGVQEVARENAGGLGGQELPPGR